MAANTTHYDVVIIGGGLVGASLACALSGLPQQQAGRSVLLIEASSLERLEPRQPGYDMRSTVLSAGSVSCFQQLGLWDEFTAQAEPILNIHVSDQGRFGTVQMNSADEGVGALGYVAENAALGRVLNSALLDRQQVALCAPATVRSVKPCVAGMRLLIQQADEESELTASLVVLAEGGRSGLGEQLGIYQQRHDYQQSAVIANVSFSKPHQGVAYERFTPKGPLALLPLPDHKQQHRAALVWTHSLADAQQVLALPDEKFLSALQHDFGDRLGTFTRVGQRASFPLALSRAAEQIRPGLVLLGNVAHTLHPVAGQGFNLALRDAMLLADNIRQSLLEDCDPGDFTRLQGYLQAVQQDQQLTISFSDYMTRMFSSSSTVLTGLRHIGMACVDLLPPVKKQLSRQAMGTAHPRASFR